MKYLFIIITALSLMNCGLKKESEVPKDPITNIGHGVYFFELSGEEFAIALAKFKHTTSHNIITVTSDNTSGYGHTKGYFVVTDEP